MSEPLINFRIEEETLSDVRDMARNENIIALCCIAPFAPTRVSPTRSVFAQFSYPDEFILEDFVEHICERFQNEDERPPLYLLIHSPGGTVSSSYVVSLHFYVIALIVL